ncbi:kinase-like domain-containing protein, partial [Gautieria morchelliformis]
MQPNLLEEGVKALRKLAVEAEVFPSGLNIEDVIVDKHPTCSGGFADVHKGKWKEKLVAVKRPRLFSSQDNAETLKQTRREMLLWRQLRHDHVLRLLGIFNEGRLLDSMVSVWMPNGTLRTFLENLEHRHRNRLHLIYQISSALEYLHTHSPPIAHGDIKAGNIFVDTNFRPVLGDFGLSCIRYTIDRTMSSTLEAGTTRWMAPELLLPDESNEGLHAKPSLESDAWAFGMLMLEIFTDDRPYSKEAVDPIVHSMITRDHKVPERPDEHITERGLTDTVWNLMTECWNFESPEKRPKAQYL